MANQNHLDLLKQGVKAWNQWREEHRDIQPDLYEAELSRAKLSGANLGQAILWRADLEIGQYIHRCYQGQDSNI